MNRLCIVFALLLSCLGCHPVPQIQTPKPLKHSAVEIHVYPLTIFAGKASTITCRVERDERNRQIRWGFGEYTQSMRTLDGAWAPITWGPYTFTNLGCDTGPAYCVVIRNDGSFERAVQELQIADCGGNQ